MLNKNAVGFGLFIVFVDNKNNIEYPLLFFSKLKPIKVCPHGCTLQHIITLSFKFNSITMTRTQQWKSRRRLRRTYSTKHTGRTVRYIYYFKDSDFPASVRLITCICCFLFVPRWDSITRRPHCCLQKQHRPLLLCDWKFPWKWGKLNLSRSCNLIIEKWATCSNSIPSLATGVMVWIVWGQTAICDN